MNGLQLLKDHPKVATVIMQFYLDKLLEGLKDDSLPDDFKDMVRQQGIDDEKIAVFINSSPRNLFDVFDDHKVHINIVKLTDGYYWAINQADNWESSYSSRKEAEWAAIQEASKLLNDKL
jgi:hypothetical protein